MSTLFLDSSAIVKYYYSEEGSTWVRSTVNSKTNVCVISQIAVVEVAAAFAQIQRNTPMGKKRMTEMYEHFRGDLRQGIFLARALDENVLTLAADLALRQALKGYDAVQVASALLVKSLIQDTSLVFISGDQQMLRAARLEGLATDDPDDHTDEDRQR